MSKTPPTWDQLRAWRQPIGTVERLLQDPGLARASDPPTSKAAAVSLDVGSHRALILRTLSRLSGPANRDSIAALSHLSPYETSKRLPELRRLGLIEERGTLVGYSGREQAAFRITEAGLRVLRG